MQILVPAAPLTMQPVFAYYGAGSAATLAPGVAQI